ncbi:cupin domain-containing protein [Desulfonema ishimotonii]|uniref:Cupin domain-containing protein n=1 Tax=Desulfonema ishimotonii TaxID=45657 RepID=A0A401FY74_9BACT|nr:cupin domain-containing protein [Desulfonema ishimotonii]GBC61894.1 cupin domain-containing protein [Desulfonema ishimotonii]
MNSTLIVPPDHVGFKARKLFDAIEGRIIDSTIAYIRPGGGGPEPAHTHPHDHIFIVMDGCAEIRVGDKRITVEKDDFLRVPGQVTHSVRNSSEAHLRMLGISVLPDD